MNGSRYDLILYPFKIDRVYRFKVFNCASATSGEPDGSGANTASGVRFLVTKPLEEDGYEIGEPIEWNGYIGFHDLDEGECWAVPNEWCTEEKLFHKGERLDSESYRKDSNCTRFYGTTDSEGNEQAYNLNAVIFEANIPTNGSTLYYGEDRETGGLTSIIVFDSMIPYYEFHPFSKFIIDPNGGTWGEPYSKDYKNEAVDEAEVAKYGQFGGFGMSAYIAKDNVEMRINDPSHSTYSLNLDKYNYWDFIEWEKSDPFSGTFEQNVDGTIDNYTFMYSDANDGKSDKITALWDKEPILAKVKVIDRIDDGKNTVLSDKQPIKTFGVDEDVSGLAWGDSRDRDAYYPGYHLKTYTTIHTYPIGSTTFPANDSENKRAIAGRRDPATGYDKDSENVIDGKAWSSNDYYDYVVYRYFEPNTYTIRCVDATSVLDDKGNLKKDKDGKEILKVLGDTPDDEKLADPPPEDAYIGMEVDVLSMWGRSVPENSIYNGYVIDEERNGKEYPRVLTADDDADHDGEIVVNRYLKPGTFKIIYKGNGATGGGPVNEQTFVYTVGAHIKGNGTDPGDTPYTKSGYRFAGWNDNQYGKGKDYYEKDLFGRAAGEARDLTLFAKWVSSPDATATLIVNHYKEQTDGTFKLADTEKQENITEGKWATPATKTYSGYRSPNTITVWVQPKSGGNIVRVNYSYYLNNSTDPSPNDGNLIVSHYLQINDKGEYRLDKRISENREIGEEVTPTVLDYGSAYKKPNAITVKIKEGKNYVDYYYDYSGSGPSPSPDEGDTVWVANHFKQISPTAGYSSTPDDVDTGKGWAGQPFTFPVRSYPGYQSPSPYTRILTRGIVNIVNYYYPIDDGKKRADWTIEHYKQNPDKSYNGYPDETDRGLEVIGVRWTAPTKPYVGYKQPEKQTITIKEGSDNFVVYHYELDDGSGGGYHDGPFSFSGAIVKVKAGGEAVWNRGTNKVKVKEPLKGAKFDLELLYNEDGTKANGKVYSTVTGSDGALGFSGLPAGVFRLYESVAPEGYHRLDKDIYINITAEYYSDGSVKEFYIYSANSVKDALNLTNCSGVLRSDGENVIYVNPLAIVNGGEGELHVYTVEGNDDSKGLKGAEYSIKNDDGKEIGTITSDN
ncbi:MAG: prealbumin-like fold domain-containing protein, partial [Lachnospiraceae bacterium]|nr:prealbumin-like fold domain-containing protein [Lachnospiraceae bacterium]